jgi:hypothetical protein
MIKNQLFKPQKSFFVAKTAFFNRNGRLQHRKILKQSDIHFK